MDCIICMEGKKNEDFVSLACNHQLCKECLQKLLRNQCPFCRKEILYKDDRKNEIEHNIIFEEEEIDYSLPDSDLDSFIYLEDIYTDDIIYYSFFSRKLNKTRQRKDYNTSLRKGFICNKDREDFQRRKKNYKKPKNYNV